jgi:uncharacterized membrane protein YeaQ/YmgE (transglycosylase-associated protein family)
MVITPVIFCDETGDISADMKASSSTAAVSNTIIAGFTPGALIGGIIFGTFGIYAFARGKKRSNVWLMIIGAALLVFPYFIRETFLLYLVGIGLCIVFYFKRS